MVSIVWIACWRRVCGPGAFAGFGDVYPAVGAVVFGEAGDPLFFEGGVLLAFLLVVGGVDVNGEDGAVGCLVVVGGVVECLLVGDVVGEAVCPDGEGGFVCLEAWVGGLDVCEEEGGFLGCHGLVLSSWI